MVMKPIYGLVRGIAIADYWHNNDECFIVKSIAPRDRSPGHGPWQRCPYCLLLDRSPVLRRRRTAVG